MKLFYRQCEEVSIENEEGDTAIENFNQFIEGRVSIIDDEGNNEVLDINKMRYRGELKLVIPEGYLACGIIWRNSEYFIQTDMSGRTVTSEDFESITYTIGDYSWKAIELNRCVGTLEFDNFYGNDYEKSGRKVYYEAKPPT